MLKQNMPRSTQSINQFICPEMQYTLDRAPMEDATSANRCPQKQS